MGEGGVEVGMQGVGGRDTGRDVEISWGVGGEQSEGQHQSKEQEREKKIVGVLPSWSQGQ